MATAKRYCILVAVGIVAGYGIVLAMDFRTTANEHAILLMAAAILVPIIYGLPTYIAYRREHDQKLPIAIINVFLGWTLIGWVVALAMACSNLKRDR